jgi:hypothetical protein
LVKWDEISDVAGELCQPNPDQSEYERAVFWYGFQVQSISPADTRIAKYACLHARLKILDFLELAGKVDGRVAFNERLNLPNYERILCSMLEGMGSWSGIGHSFRRKELATDISVRWSEAGDAALFIEFSLRFKHVNSARKAGATMAREFVIKTANIGDGTARQRWRDYGELALIRLLLEKLDLKPVPLNKKIFVERLLKQASDASRIREFFGAYEFLAKKLRSRGYDYPVLVPENLKSVSDPIPLPPFSDHEKQAIQDLWKDVKF